MMGRLKSFRFLSCVRLVLFLFNQGNEINHSLRELSHGYILDNLNKISACHSRRDVGNFR